MLNLQPHCQWLAPTACAPCLSSSLAGNTKGVDSTAASHEALEAAKQLATTYKCIVAVSGANDLVGAQHTLTPLLARIAAS